MRVRALRGLAPVGAAGASPGVEGVTGVSSGVEGVTGVSSGVEGVTGVSEGVEGATEVIAPAAPRPEPCSAP